MLLAQTQPSSGLLQPLPQPTAQNRRSVPLRIWHKTLTVRRLLFLNFCSLDEWQLIGRDNVRAMKIHLCSSEKSNELQFHALKHISATMKEIQSSLFSFVIAEYHIVETNRQAATELLSLCISHLRECTTCVPSYVPARCVYSMAGGQMKTNKSFIY